MFTDQQNLILVVLEIIFTGIEVNLIGSTRTEHANCFLFENVGFELILHNKNVIRTSKSRSNIFLFSQKVPSLAAPSPTDGPRLNAAVEPNNTEINTFCMM